MSKKAGEELKSACYSFTNLTSLPISISVNILKKPKMIKMKSLTVVEGGQAALL